MAVDPSPSSKANAGGSEAGQPAPVPERTRLVVGIGASAGSIEAFKAFFSRMPADIGMAFVIVQHLDPNFESALVAIIAGYTKLPVRLAEDGAMVGPNTIQVIPPNAILTIKGGILRLARPAAPAARRTSVNTFLASLAEDQGENAVGIILSGFGSDGALGIAAIKEHGDLTLSQAEFDHHALRGMPQSAVSGGFVDHVLAVEDMPQALEDYRRHRAICDAHKGPDGVRDDLPGQLATICAVLHGQLGRDFSHYKAGTLMRRIQRRMHVLQTDEVPDYVERLRTHPPEAELLFRELLISVTRFFRDPEAFETLEAKVISGLLAEDGAEPVRVWVAGCATGEEAYSVAILLKEAQMRSGSRRAVQVFATDLDDRAVATARAGLYLGTIGAEMSAERLERHFVREDGSYRVAKDIREMCLFSTHDLVKDPPFSRMDLVCCRNLLIYFEPLLQQRVVATFHYALRPGRHLFPGPSESIASQVRLFAPFDKRHRIYSKREAAASLPVLPSRMPAGAAPPRQAALPTADDIDRRAARAIARYAPAFLVVDHHHEVVRFSGHTAKYLEPATGVASLHLFALLHADLRAAARTALKEAAVTGERAVKLLSMEVGDRYEVLNLVVEALPGPGEEGLFVVVFQDAAAGATAPSLREETDAGVQATDGNLLGTKERLRTLSEELEAAHEELQSSNEEYLSINEELQSANEELETSKEELQSLNEELQTINAELNTRNDSLVRSNSDLANLFDSTSIAILFLDRNLRIRRFTPRLLEIFNLRDGDEGRPISDIVTRLTRDGLGQDVLRTLAPREREVMLAEGMSFLMQVRPYRDLNNVIDGAVLTFVDISERKRHEQARSRLAAIVESSQDAIIGFDLHGTVASWNDGAERLFGLPTSKAVGQSMLALLDQPLPWEWADMLARLQDGEQLAVFEHAGAARDGRPIEASVTVSPVKEGDGRIVGVSLVARDIRERRAAECKAALLLGELDHRVKNILQIISVVVTQTLRTTATPEAFTAEVNSRVQAIAKAHSLLTQSGQGEVSLRTILETELAPYDRGGGSLVIAGRDVSLTPKASLALAMAVHELASNAAKYGALSVPSGRLAVEWTVAADSAPFLMTLAWTEAGGPAVSPPTRRGFGTTLIERALAYDLDAEVSREFLPGGVRCTVFLPLTEEVGYPRTADNAEETS